MQQRTSLKKKSHLGQNATPLRCQQQLQDTIASKKPQKVADKSNAGKNANGKPMKSSSKRRNEMIKK
jgi:hypothetical protein